MNASFLVSPSLRGWFAASELAPHIETFVERLVRDGYSCRTALAALVPPPRLHRYRYYGVLAPNSPLRTAVTAHLCGPRADSCLPPPACLRAALKRPRPPESATTSARSSPLPPKIHA